MKCPDIIRASGRQTEQVCQWLYHTDAAQFTNRDYDRLSWG